MRSMETNKVEIEEQLSYIEKVAKINEGKNYTYYILTMGCQLNENDSEKLCGMAEKMGYTQVTEMSSADLIIFNTCCIRENAEDKLFGKLGEAKKVKEKRSSIIAIGGCMMQEKEMIKKIHESYPFVDVLFGTHTLHKFPENLYKAVTTNKKLEDILDIDGEIIEGLPIKRDDQIKASVTIMNGCNNFCSYCIVPYVRGRERSRTPKDIIEEIRCLAKQGYKEITLLGQNVNSYLRVENEKNIEYEKYEGVNSFATLLRAVNKIDGIERIRFVSPHPKDFTDDVIEAIKDCDKVCKLVHLPLQSGSTNVLRVMNRKYSKEQFLNLVEKMKNNIPNLTISTDIIVGFPGETEEDFLETLDVVDKVGYSTAFTFIYSKRTGTPAAVMENQIPDDVTKERFNRLLEHVNSGVEKISETMVGTVENVLVEEINRQDETMLTGRTERNSLVHFKGNPDLIGQIVPVKIKENKIFYLIGERML